MITSSSVKQPLKFHLLHGQKNFCTPSGCLTGAVRVAGEMITKILHIIETVINRIHPQSQSRGPSAWQREFLFIQEKSRLTLAPIGQENLPRCDFSSGSYDTVSSPYDTHVRAPALATIACLQHRLNELNKNIRIDIR
jgi:hypothetical protein